MPFSRYWRSELESVIIVENTTVHLNIGMWRDGSDGEKERVVRCDSFVKQIVCFLGKHICDILSLIASRCFSTTLERAVQIIVRVRVEKEVLSQVSGYDNDCKPWGHLTEPVNPAAYGLL